MLTLQTVILRHTRASDTHYDWLFEHPRPPGGAVGRLVTFRMGLCFTGGWAPSVQLVRRLPDHRRAYLTYQGPVSGGRGRVLRVGRGFAYVRLWSQSRIVMEMELEKHAWAIEVKHVTASSWRVLSCVMPAFRSVIDAS
ncbi:MAG: hypothetical protein GC164_05240 [Phycisphaera sp.]|nr:hypothetical protein [Phycisphaera sp.]